MSGGGGGSNDLWRPLPALTCPLPCSLVLSGPKRPCWVLGTKSRALNIQEGETKPLPPLSPAAPSAPSSVKFSELTTTSVNVSWEAPQFPNGILEGYRLVYEPCTPVDGEWGGSLPAWLPGPALCTHPPPYPNPAQSPYDELPL